ncbi:hypothetical protein HDK77DRAFT_73095 [Phyllosticta capitalensis]|uniref:polynucleotide adenylyltransferase n=2 Tax=Phyllosticta capitalensis TaxID=121624 RepID=A0ABR1YQF2_9PEZI
MGEYKNTEADPGHLYRILDTRDHLFTRRVNSGHSLPLHQLTSAPHPLLVSPPAQSHLLDYRNANRPVHSSDVFSNPLRPLPPPAITVSQEQQPGPSASGPTHNTNKAFAKSTKPPQQLDGNNVAAERDTSDKSQVTSDTATNMSSRGVEGVKSTLPPRPPMTSHHSNSVPSTPHQHARDLTFRSRSPSPNGVLGNHSPRSVSSEANGPLPSLRKQPYKCKYETGIAFGRRRIPYENSDMLEKAAVPPKACLNPEEDEKLSGDMRELYDRLLPSGESQDRRRRLVEKLSRILHSEWPGNEFKVHVFGSSGNLLCTTESDVDICIQTPMRKLESVHMLAEALAKHGMSKVVCVASAKVPIVKVWDPELELACDMNVNNTLALENTRMIKTYVQIDERVRPLTMIIKHWTKRRILNDAALGGTLSSYTWICTVLNFLQTRDPPILPSLHMMPFEKHPTETGEESGFFDDLEQVRGFGNANKESLGQLLFHFFRLYGHEFEYEEDVISVRQGRVLTRKEKGWELNGGSKEGRYRLCVEEPFNTSRNLGNSADDYAFRGIHLEIRQAFDYLADGGQLDKACEQYVYPKEERTIFQKPPPAPKPTLTHSTSPSRRPGRNGGGGRGGRHHYSQRNGQGDRRASGAPSYTNGLPFLSPPLTGAAPDYFAATTGASLHEQLYKQYQMLEMQQHTLKAQLFAQAQARAAHAHVMAQAQAQARNGSSHGSPPRPQYATMHATTRDPNDPPATAPIMPPGYIYAYPPYDHSQQMAQMNSQEGVRTNPSSPSLPLSVPNVRRGVHRASVEESSANSAVRSHSQPARPDQNGGFLIPNYPPIPGYPPHIMAYPIARSSQDHQHPRPQPVDVPAQAQGLGVVREPAQNGSPKEYLGYFMSESPQFRSHPLHDYSVSQIPTFQELAQRRKRMSQDSEAQRPSNSLQVSRSPSPPRERNHARSTSTGLRGTTATSGPLPQVDRSATAQPPPADSGPVIVNGSYRASKENRNPADSMDSSAFTDRDSISSNGVAQRPDEPFPMEMPIQEQQFQLYANEVMKRHLSREKDAPNGDLSGNSSHGVMGGYTSAGPAVSTAPATNGDGEYHSPGSVSPKGQPIPPWRVKHTNGVTPMDPFTLAPHVVHSSALPMLSPVQETRTPSPATSRTVTSTATNGVGAGGEYIAANAETVPPHPRYSPPVPQLSKHAHQSKKDSPAVNGKGAHKGNSGGNASGWQKSGGGKKGGRKRAKSNASKSGGEPPPANEAERKGG